MVIEQILKTEDNINIYLHKEGLFWRAYEYSAYGFIVYIRQYTARKKFIKKVDREVVFIGFPHSSLVNILDLCKQNGFSVNKNNSLIKIEFSEETEGYDKWKEAITITDSNKNIKDDATLVKRIADFPLATKTPIEAQQFLYEIQLEIDGNL